MLRNVQHKKEAYWFYRFLSIFYDHYVNPFFWTEKMRAESLHLGASNPSKRACHSGVQRARLSSSFM